MQVAPGTSTGVKAPGVKGFKPGPTQISGIQIIDNVFDNTMVPAYPGLAGTNGVTITNASNVSGMRVGGVTIARNSFTGFGEGNGEGVGMWATSPQMKIGGIVVKENTFSRDLFAIELNDDVAAPRLTGVQIISNTINSAGLAQGIAIAVLHAGTNAITDGTVIANNTITGYDNGTSIAISAQVPLAPGVVGASTPVSDVVSNTQLVNSTGGNLLSLTPGTSGSYITGVVIRNTILWDPNGSPINGVIGPMPQYQQPPDVVTNSLISGPSWAGTNGNVNTNPQFVNEAGSDYQLAAGSPAINAGTTIGAPSFDLNGARRDAQPDIGAYEYGAALSPLLTVTAYLLGGKGTITSNPAAVNCGAICSAGFDPNTKVTLTARPARGSRFLGWRGACSGTRRCTVTLTGSKLVAARFGPG